jgi:phage shock protein PspC (stress-responsive transcriptional regulator)
MSETRTEPPQGPRVTRDRATDLGRLVRTSSASPENRYLGGVAGGIARHLDIDPLIVRIALVIAVFFGGSGVILYGACWLFVPDEKDGKAVITVDARSRNVVLWLAAIVAAVSAIGDVAGGIDFPWWLIPTGILVLILTRVWDFRDVPSREAKERAAAAAGTAATATASATTAAATATDEALTRAAAATQAALDQAHASTELALSKARQRAANKRGPVLFWFTMALVALAEVALGVIDGAGASISGSAYPALALGLIGVMLLVGAFWGRAGGLILAGLIAVGFLGAATANDRWGDDHRIHETPTAASTVADRYSFGVGDLTLDLRRVSDLAGLDGRTIEVRGTLGDLTVIVPPQIGVRATANLSGFGEIDLLGHRQDGISVSATGGNSAAPGQPSITIDARLKVGQITITDDESELSHD